MFNFKLYYTLAKDTAVEFSDDNASVYAASLSYYTLFSIAPLLLIAISIAGFFFGEKAAQQGIAIQLEHFTGKDIAGAAQSLLQYANLNPESGFIATAIGLVTLIFGASGVFNQLQTALNAIWGVKPKAGLGIWGVIQARLLSFGMVFLMGALLLASLILSAVLSAIQKLLPDSFPFVSIFGQAFNLCLSFAVITFLFAAIYKVLPDVQIPWKNVWTGAVVTSLFFTLGKYLIGLYLGKSGVSSAYGAAGSLVALLVWVFYSAQIFLFGAEFTQVYSKHLGIPLEPSVHAEKISPPELRLAEKSA